MNNLVVCGIDVHQDAEGRYSLNDLHRAAGGDNKLRPSLWAENQQAKLLISTLATENSKAGIPALESIQGGPTRGTYACKELVYAYAMWMSPDFYLHVIRTFDTVVTGNQAPDRWIHLADVFAQVLAIHGRTTVLDAVITPTIYRRLIEALKNPDVQEFLLLHDGPVTDAFARQDKVCLVASLAFSQASKFDDKRFGALRKWAAKARALTMEQVLLVENRHVSPFRFPGQVAKVVSERYDLLA